MDATSRTIIIGIITIATLIAGATLIDLNRNTSRQPQPGIMELEGTPEPVTTTTTGPVAVIVELPAVALPVAPATIAPAPSGDCWTDLATQIGWPTETLGTLERIIRRESGCDPAAFADRPSTFDNSRGLLQINAYGNLAEHIRNVCGVEPDQLFDPAVNLACGLVYYQRSGWRPWGF